MGAAAAVAAAVTVGGSSSDGGSGGEGEGDESSKNGATGGSSSSSSSAVARAPLESLAPAIIRTAVTSTPGDNKLTDKVVAEDGSIVERAAGVVPAERAMRTNEMFLKLVNKKGVPLVQEKILQVLRELATHGQ